MVLIFTGLTHIVLFVAALGMLALIAYVILGGFFGEIRQNQETFMRGLAAACGLLIYLGSRAVGLSVPDLMFKALATSFPVVVGIAGIVVPALVGFIVSWYVISHLKSRDALQSAVGMRILTMIVVFVFFLYCDSYIASFGAESKAAFVNLLPNLSFVLAVLLYAVFKFHPDMPSDTGSGQWVRKKS